MSIRLTGFSYIAPNRHVILGRDFKKNPGDGPTFARIAFNNSEGVPQPIDGWGGPFNYGYVTKIVDSYNKVAEITWANDVPVNPSLFAIKKDAVPGFSPDITEVEITVTNDPGGFPDPNIDQTAVLRKMYIVY